jgi:hypothetical protein
VVFFIIVGVGVIVGVITGSPRLLRIIRVLTTITTITNTNYNNHNKQYELQ